MAPLSCAVLNGARVEPAKARDGSLRPLADRATVGDPAPVDESSIHFGATMAMLVFAVLTYVSLTFVSAPYGRFVRDGWGPSMSARMGWIVMESPAAIVWALIFFQGQHRFETVPLIFLGLWQLHYFRRTFIYPMRMRLDGKTMPVSIAAMAVGFNLLNAYCNARMVSHLATYETSWLLDPRFSIGVGIFVLGWLINGRADERLRLLRAPGETGYKVPKGGLHDWVAAPNYLGEIIEWVGWAIATWSLAGLAFAIYTFANLAPRAHSNLRWSKEKFGDEWPAHRKALIPGLW